MDTLRDVRLLESLWDSGQGARGRCGDREHAVLARPADVLVTGATGLVGGWLVERLVDAGADVVCLVRDWVPAVRAGALAARSSA